MTSLVERQVPIDMELANALVIATPETWNAAEMTVEREQEGSRETMKISISNPEGLRDLVGPTDEIYTGLYKLSDLFREYGKMWVRVSYFVSLNSDGSWKYTVKFEY
jgi:hypothetical protein